jgi:hypothetical protein
MSLGQPSAAIAVGTVFSRNQSTENRVSISAVKPSIDDFRVMGTSIVKRTTFPPSIVNVQDRRRPLRPAPMTSK